MAPSVAILNNGKSMPTIGLGTWRSPSSVMTNVVKDAIDMGYRHFDCAHIYGNEAEIGEAFDEKINDGTVNRDEIFVTSKLWNTFHSPDMVKGACLTSLHNLRLAYLDLYLIHWPMGYRDGTDPYPKDQNGRIIYSGVDYLQTWAAMESLVYEDLCRSIGICNFNIPQIERLLKNAKIKPQVLQAECHPYLQQEELVDFCKQNNIVFTAYSPLGSAHTPYSKPGDFPLLENPVIKSIAEIHDCNAAQVLLRFHMQRGSVVIPRSIDKLHLKSNLAIENIQLDEDDMEALHALDLGENGRIVRMDVCRDHPFYPFKVDDVSEIFEEEIS